MKTTHFLIAFCLLTGSLSAQSFDKQFLSDGIYPEDYNPKTFYISVRYYDNPYSNSSNTYINGKLPFDLEMKLSTNLQLEQPKWLSAAPSVNAAPQNNIWQSDIYYYNYDLLEANGTYSKDVIPFSGGNYAMPIVVPPSNNPDNCITFYPNGTHSWESSDVKEIVSGFKEIFKQ